MADDYAYVPGGGGGGGGSSGSAMGRKQDHSLKDPSQRHPNQYTKKRAQAQGGGGGVGGSAMMGSFVPSAMSAGGSLYPPIPSHPLGMTAIDAVKEKRRGAEPLAPAMSQNGNSSRAGSVVGGGGGNGGGQHLYGAGGMASQDEYNLATLGGNGGGGQRGTSKRKVEESGGASKRRKKGYVSYGLSTRTRSN